MSSAAAKKAIKEFRTVTGATEKVATDLLTRFAFNMDGALDAFFAGSAGQANKAGKADPAKLNKIFDQYAGQGDEKDLIADERLGQFFADIAVNPEGAATLGIAWQIKCKNIGEIERKEFVQGFSAMNADTIDAIKKEARRIEGALADKRQFRDFYRWLFDFVKDGEERKTIDNETAYEMWTLVLTPHFPLTAEFIDFCKSQKLKAIPKDLWEQLFEFARDVKPDFSNYEEDGAWPVAIDTFVEQIKAKKK